MKSSEIKALVAQMSLSERAAITSGATPFTTYAVERLGIPSVFMTDGPHGVRNNRTATCFPTACLAACSFDPNVSKSIGAGIARECGFYDVKIILGPGLNIKRSPLCGRNFEYYSEDPVLSGKMAAAHIKGVQTAGTAACAKHYALNNQEFRRMSIDVVADAQTIREIYLKAFEIVVKSVRPLTIMGSYNRVNGTYACENKTLLTDILRKEWGFKGFVVSDWGAVDDRVASIKAGLDLEMPSSGGLAAAEIEAAVRSGRLKESVLNRAVSRIVQVLLKLGQTAATGKEARLKSGDTIENALAENTVLAGSLAADSLVLLKNDGGLLPLKDGVKKIAVIGRFAKEPRFQGGGSSKVKAGHIAVPLEEIAKRAPAGAEIFYADGYPADTPECDEGLSAEAARAAREADVVLLFCGLPEYCESEGYDRETIDMPESHIRLIETVCAANKNTAVILQNGGAVAIGWKGLPSAILETYLGGESVGAAIADVLFGIVNPSGRLAETFPVSIKDTPAYTSFPGNAKRVEYREGLFVGYRHYITREIPVAFPFGFGLSYTTFRYKNWRLSDVKFQKNDVISVRGEIRNTGTTDGKEVAQLYIRNLNYGPQRPLRELKAFKKVLIKRGKTVRLEFKLPAAELAVFDVNLNSFVLESGRYGIDICRDSQTPVASFEFTIETKPPKIKYTRNTCIGDITKTEAGRSIAEAEIIEPMCYAIYGAFNAGIKLENGHANDLMFDNIMQNMPLRALINLSGNRFDERMLESVLARLNGR
ncbi:glycosyl hydrolase [Clostridia bacterium]|nr:glycosyl hydrolase [Clostridia bacterium]